MLTWRRVGVTGVTSCPCKTIRPSSGTSKPAIIRKVVVLPQPLGPSSEKNSPSPIESVTSCDGLDVAEALSDTSTAMPTLPSLGMRKFASNPADPQPRAS